MRLLAPCVLLLAVIAAPTHIHAQRPAPSDEELREARTFFVEGSTAADESRWADAVRNFRQS